MPLKRSRSPDREYQVSCAFDSAGRSSRSAASSVRLALPGALEVPLHLATALEQDRLVCQLLLEGALDPYQVVGEQPRPGIADVGLDHRRLARDLGLTAERLELAPDLGQQVLQPGEVPVGRLELAESLLLALAVLEDACGLLDEAATVLRESRGGSSRAGPARR